MIEWWSNMSYDKELLRCCISTHLAAASPTIVPTFAPLCHTTPVSQGTWLPTLETEIGLASLSSYRGQICRPNLNFKTSKLFTYIIYHMLHIVTFFLLKFINYIMSQKPAEEKLRLRFWRFQCSSLSYVLVCLGWGWGYSSEQLAFIRAFTTDDSYMQMGCRATFALHVS